MASAISLNGNRRQLSPCLPKSETDGTYPYALRELVKAVYVEAPDKSSGKRKQKIHISYDLIGFIPVDVLTKAEQA